MGELAAAAAAVGKWIGANPGWTFALLAGLAGAKPGIQALAELVRAVRGKNGNGNGKHMHDHTDKLREDFASLPFGPAKPSTSDPDVLAGDVKNLEGQITRLGHEQREGREFLQQQVTDLTAEVALCNEGLRNLPDAIVEKLASRPVLSEEARKLITRDAGIASAKTVFRALRREGVLPERRKAPQTSLPPDRERRGNGSE